MKKSSWIPTLIAGLLLLALPTTTTSLDYSPDAGDGSISLEDEATRIGGLKTIFIGDTTLVTLNDIVWSPDDSVGNSSSLMWETSVNGVVQDSGMVELSEEALDLPTSISAGSIVVDKSKCRHIYLKNSLFLFLTFFLITCRDVYPVWFTPQSKFRLFLSKSFSWATPKRPQALRVISQPMAVGFLLFPSSSSCYWPVLRKWLSSLSFWESGLVPAS